MCKTILLVCVIRDRLNPPKEDTLLVVTHPDDDVLFFHTAIKEYNPYIVLMATGWSIKRLIGFLKTMSYYGVKFRPYDTSTTSKHLEKAFSKQVKSVYNCGNFKRCLTHNSTGEYGHRNHKLVHNCVIKNVDCEIYVPVSAERITHYPLDNETINEKKKIFEDFYVTETFVIDEYKEWLENEQLERYIPDEED